MMHIPDSLQQAYDRLEEGCAWVLIIPVEDDCWIYSSEETVEDIQEELRYVKMGHERSEFIVRAVLQLERDHENGRNESEDS